jgi:hypothetical protein
MVVRVIVGVGWSLVTGLAGGWLIVSPWALAEQSSGSGWSTVTETQFWSGTGLVALAITSLIVVASQLTTVLRQSRPTSGLQRIDHAIAPGDSTLIALANALIADLDRQRMETPSSEFLPGPSQRRPPHQSSGVVAPNGPPDAHESQTAAESSPRWTGQ